jgi:hypothetical protein
MAAAGADRALLPAHGGMAAATHLRAHVAHELRDLEVRLEVLDRHRDVAERLVRCGAVGAVGIARTAVRGTGTHLWDTPRLARENRYVFSG